MAIIQTHTSTSQMSGDGAADHILDGSFGFNLSNAVLKLIDSEHNLHADGQTIISDGTFVIGTNASKKLIFSTDDTERIQITTDGALDILSQKLLINGNAGTSGLMLTTLKLCVVTFLFPMCPGIFLPLNTRAGDVHIPMDPGLLNHHSP